MVKEEEVGILVRSFGPGTGFLDPHCPASVLCSHFPCTWDTSLPSQALPLFPILLQTQVQECSVNLDFYNKP